MRRERLRTTEIGDNLSFSKYINMVFEEPLILHHFAQKNQYYHWIEHLNSFQRFINGPIPNYSMSNNFDEVKYLISDGLKLLGFDKQATQIVNAENEDDLNKTIIKQYTEENPLYSEVNQNLRKCHIYQNDVFEGNALEKYHFELAPWILQLNVAIRRQPAYEQKSYRGTTLSEEDIKLYRVNELFVWAPFVSASKSKEECFGGNVIFEIFTESAMSLNDKRFARDISGLSHYPDEQEVIFPIACAYRVKYVTKEKDVYIIGVATVDYN